MSGARQMGLQPGKGQHVEIQGVTFGVTAVFKAEATAGRVTVCQRAGDDEAVVCFVVSGNPRLVQDAEPVLKTTPGSAWMHGNSSHFTVEWPEQGTLIGVALPQLVLRDLGIQGALMIKDLGCGGVLREPIQHFLTSVAEGTDEIPSVAAHVMERLVHNMVSGVLIEESRVVLTANTTTPALFDQAMSLMVVQAGNSSTTPSTLARELNVSLRHLQRAFQQRGTSIAERLRTTRTELAIRLLGDSRGAGLSFHDVASLSGFSSVGHLRRTLKKAGYEAPTYLRTAAVPRRILSLESRTPKPTSN